MPKPSNARDVTPPETQFTQFEQRSDDSETLWNAVCILAEKKNMFLVKWEGIDESTGQPWPDSWVAKEDCTNPLIDEWRYKKRREKLKSDKAKRNRDKARRSAQRKSNQSFGEHTNSTSPTSRTSIKNTKAEFTTSPLAMPQNNKPTHNRLRMEVELQTTIKHNKNFSGRDSRKRKRAPSIAEEEEEEGLHESEEGRDEPDGKRIRRRVSEQEVIKELKVEGDGREPSPIPIIVKKKKKKREISEEVLPPPPTNPNLKEVKLKTYIPPRDSPLLFSHSQYSPLGPYQTQQAEYVNSTPFEADAVEDEESQSIFKPITISGKPGGISTDSDSPALSVKENTNISIASSGKRHSPLMTGEKEKVEWDGPLGSPSPDQKKKPVIGHAKDKVVTEQSAQKTNRGLHFQRVNGVLSSKLPKNPKRKPQTRFAVQYDDDDALSPEGSVESDTRSQSPVGLCENIPRSDLGSLQKRKAMPISISYIPENEANIEMYDGSIIPETQPSQNSLSSENRPDKQVESLNLFLRDTAKSNPSKSLAQVPELTPSKFKRYLPLPLDQPSSPVEEFTTSELKHPTQSAVESIVEDLTHTQQNRTTSLQNSQQSDNGAEFPIFKQKGDKVEVSRSTTPEYDRQTLKQIEDNFVDYDGGRDINSGIIYESQLAGAEAENEAGLHLSLGPDKEAQPSMNDPTALQRSSGDTSKLSTASNAVEPTLSLLNTHGTPPTIASLSGDQPIAPTLNHIGANTLITQPTPRTLRRTQQLAVYTELVPENAFDQLDKALKLLNEKSEENRKLSSRLLDKEKESFLRELEFQKQFKEMEVQHRMDIVNQQEDEAFFKKLYLQASDKHKEVAMLYSDQLTENDLLKQRVETGVSQVRDHFSGQISQLRTELYNARARADLFMEQASRTASVRQDAGEAPVLRARVARLSKELAESLEREKSLELKARSSEDSEMVASIRQELARLMDVERNLRSERRKLQRELDRVKEELEVQKQKQLGLVPSQATSMDERGEHEVFLCQWAFENWCGAELVDREELKRHFIDQHLTSNGVS